MSKFLWQVTNYLEGESSNLKTCILHVLKLLYTQDCN